MPGNLYEEFESKMCLKSNIVDSVASLSRGETILYQQEMFHIMLLRTNRSSKESWEL